MKRPLYLLALMLLPCLASAQHLDCATTLFSQPGIRFMHKLCTFPGDSLVEIKKLPSGLKYNKERHLVEGRLKDEGRYQYLVTLMHEEDLVTDTVHVTCSRTLQQPVPFMGWLSWNVVESEISTDVVETVADAFVNQGLLASGYHYLVIDDYWHAPQRDSITHRPIEDPRKFPNGMKEASRAAHLAGLKFGIYSDAGEKTCAGMFGSFGYESEDAQQYADWGVDLLKYDYCYAPTDRETALERYSAMGEALKATGRPILYYMCEWGQRQPWLWAHQTGASCWRTTYDTRDGWEGTSGGVGILQSIEGMKDIWKYSGVNRYNDADMLCVGIHGKGKSSSDLVKGKPGMTQDEYATQFALWCMWASPLTLSFDLRKTISEEDKAIICNPELIAINQDLMGLQAEFLYEQDSIQVYMKELENGDVALAVVNLSTAKQEHPISFNRIPALENDIPYYRKDLVHHCYLPECTNGFNTILRSHETGVYRLGVKGKKNSDSAPHHYSTRFEEDKLIVDILGGNDSDKRLVVTDLDGRILDQADGKGQHFKFNLSSCKSAHCILTISCQAQSKRLFLSTEDLDRASQYDFDDPVEED